MVVVIVVQQQQYHGTLDTCLHDKSSRPGMVAKSSCVCSCVCRSLARSFSLSLPPGVLPASHMSCQFLCPTCGTPKEAWHVASLCPVQRSCMNPLMYRYAEFSSGPRSHASVSRKSTPQSDPAISSFFGLRVVAKLGKTVQGLRPMLGM